MQRYSFILSRLGALALIESACGGHPAGGSTASDGASSGESASEGPRPSGSTTTTSASSDAPTSTSVPGSSSSSGDTGTTGDDCVMPEIDFEVLELHLADLVGIAELTATHPGPKEAVSFFTAPGYGTFDVAYAGPLIMECSEPLMYDPYCEEGRCSQISCTGQGAGWEVRTWLEPAPVTKGDFEFSAMETKTAWADGETGMSFTLTSTAVRGQEDWSVSGLGTLNLAKTMTVEETFPALVPGATTVLTDAVDGQVHAGALTVDGVEIAIVTPDGHLQPTGQCP